MIDSHKTRSAAHRHRLLLILCASPALLSCSHIVYEPAPVVPTASPLPYSATVKLLDIEAYTVTPGATMIADPHIENHVSGIDPSLAPAKKQWEESVSAYLAARKTFRPLVADSQADLDLAMRINIYIDPGLMWKFNHVYIARIDVALVHPRTGKRMIYLGIGKSPGEVSRGGKEDDRGPINTAVQSALNDVFGKIEEDRRLRRQLANTLDPWSDLTTDEFPFVSSRLHFAVQPCIAQPNQHRRKTRPWCEAEPFEVLSVQYRSDVAVLSYKTFQALD